MNEFTTITKNNQLQTTESQKHLIQALNTLLADYQMYYQNLRGFHWNIKGKEFFALHAQFEEMYLRAAENIDMIAERVLSLRDIPLHSYADYIERAEIKAARNIKQDDLAVEIILQNIQILNTKLRNLIEISEKANDSSSEDMAVELLRNLEKKAWMMRSFLA